ncbi:MAG TPA: 4'-phosphopantetheinyl transferase superfamily protein [Crocinitomicaceae bacterium]|nr:4'-phosphopantetheinyl transferase superfamily protein [Crocinitomicaceae bacterium]
MTPFKFEKIQINQSSLFFCRFQNFNPKDYYNYLSKAEITKIELFKSKTRRMEYAAARILRHFVFGFKHIEYTEYGAPYIDGKGFISISHTYQLVVLAFNPNYKIAIDLETPRENILEIAPKFLSENEKKMFDVANKLELTKIWSSKETLYKLAGRKKIHFKSELLLSTDEENNWIGTIINPGHQLLVKLHIFDHEGTIVTLNDEEIIKK